MEEKSIYTMAQWAKDGVFSAKPGQFVEESIYWQMLNCVPPRSVSRGYMQVGEADGTCPKTGRNTYATFAREGGMWKFVGYLPYGEGKPRLKNFFDLVFEPHTVADIPEYGDHKRAVMEFENGYGISVLFGNLFYSDGETSYEVAVLKDGKVCVTTSITDDVIGYLTIPEVSEIMARIQRL